MMAAPAPLSPAAANALAAFLRGVERRALVVAQLQAGDDAVAARAVAVAMRAFAGHAADLPMVDWPARFWGLLCSTPQLLAPPAGGQWPVPLRHLQQLAAADRLALLLRIGAGLDEAIAAPVLGVSIDAYRQALAGACPLDAGGYPDAAGWRALAEQVQTQVRDLAAARVLQLEQLRESLTGDAPVAKPAAATAAPMIRPRAATARKPRPRWSWRTWLLLCLPLLLLVVVALWAWRGGPRGAAAAAPADGVLTDNGPVQVEALDDDSTPAPPASDVPAADAAMLADPELALAREADFHAWVAAGGPLPVDESQPQPSRPEPATAALETVDAEN
jgi:hypothetical protein